MPDDSVWLSVTDLETGFSGLALSGPGALAELGELDVTLVTKDPETLRRGPLVGVRFQPAFAVSARLRTKFEEALGDEIECRDVIARGDEDPFESEAFTIVRPTRVVDAMEEWPEDWDELTEMPVGLRSPPPEDLSLFRAAGESYETMWFFTDRFVDFCVSNGWKNLDAWCVWDGDRPVVPPRLENPGIPARRAASLESSWNRDRRAEAVRPVTGEGVREVFRFTGYQDGDTVFVEAMDRLIDVEPAAAEELGTVWLETHDGGRGVRSYDVKRAGTVFAVTPRAGFALSERFSHDLALVAVMAAENRDEDNLVECMLVQPLRIFDLLDQATVDRDGDGNITRHSFGRVPAFLPALFRLDDETAIVHVYFTDRFVDGCRQAGIDGLAGELVWFAERDLMSREFHALT